MNNKPNMKEELWVPNYYDQVIYNENCVACISEHNNV